MLGGERTGGRSPAPRRALVALCLTEITSWGVLYYAFPVLLGAITAETGWSAATAMGGFSAGLAVSALAGVPVGRAIDRYGPRRVMTTGSLLGPLAVLAIASAGDPMWFTVAWMAAGLAQAALFYPPAFAALTHWYGPRRVRALTILTLAAGLSSTVFAPLTAALLDHFSWRAIYLLLGGLLAVVTVPLHAGLLNPPWRPHPATPHDGGRSGGEHVTAVLRSRAFLALTVAMALAMFALMAGAITLVPLLTERGMSTGFAAWVLGLSGAGQLLGRVGYQALVRRTTVLARTVGLLLLAGVTTALVGVVTGPPALVIAVAVLAGAARGLFTLLSATAVSDRWGTLRFGTLNGALHAPMTAGMAVAPWLGTLLAGALGGYPAMFGVLAGLLALAGVVSLATRPGRPGGHAGADPPDHAPA